jgi:outer membrane protein assembly factor BamA
MSNLNINGRTVDPTSIRKISVPEGESPSSYVHKNEALIRKNFKDELYFEQNGELFVTEDRFVVESLGGNLKDAKLRMGAVPAIALLLDNEPDSHKVTELEFKGASSETEWLKKELGIKSGSHINLHDLQKQADKLFKSNRFLSVNFIPTATDKGIKLTLEVTEVPKEIRFHGSDRNQEAQLKTLFPQPLSQENIAKGMQELQKMHDKDPNSLLSGLDFKINGNSLDVMISKVQVPQNLNFVGMNLQESHEVENFFQKPLNYENIHQGMEKMRTHFAKQGMILPTLEFNVKGQDLTIQMSKTPMPTRTEIKGASVYPEAELKAMFKAPLTMEHIQEGLRAIEQKYNDDGYLLMPPEGVSADLDKGVLSIQVREAKLGDIQLSGNDKTKSEVIMRELRQHKDQPVNIKTLDKDLQRVSGTGLFAGVNKTIEPDPQNPEKVNIRLHASEEKTSSFNVGAGYSMSNGPFGTASLNLGNVAGMNRKLSIDGTLGTKVWGGGLSYYDPWMFENRTSFGASVYHRQWQGPYSDETRTGAKVSLGRPLGDIYSSPWRGDVTLSAERIGIDQQYSVSGTGTDYRFGVRPSVTYSTLDDPVMPHSGTRFQAGAEPVWASGRMIGKLDASVSHNIPMGERFTLTGGLQGGTILGDAPLYEKYNNAGLGRTLMGWESDGKQVGSNYALASAGVNAQIWGPISATAKITAGDYFEGTAISPKVGAGVGINVKVGNFGVLNAGYGFKLVGKEKDDSPGAFHLGFGIPF